MKKFILGVLTFLLIIGFGGCSDEKVQRYSNLPVKNDLSYFLTPKKYVGQFLVSLDKQNNWVYDEDYYFNIDRNQIAAPEKAKINSKDFNQFQIDDFENKLKSEFKKSLNVLREDFNKDVVKHIRIINLNIPISYSKYEKDVALIKIKNQKLITKLEVSRKIKSSDLIKEALNNNYISKYIVSSDKEYKLQMTISSLVSANKLLNTDFIVKGTEQQLNTIGKKNNGKDYITEVTLHSWMRFYNANAEGIKFIITSFKLKSDNSKRFILKYNVNDIDSAENGSFADRYIIQDDNVEIYND